VEFEFWHEVYRYEVYRYKFWSVVDGESESEGHIYKSIEQEIVWGWRGEMGQYNV